MTQSTLQAYGYENSNFSPNYVIFKKWLILLISPWVNFYLYYENNITMILIVFCSVIFHSLLLWKYFHYNASEAVNPRQAAVRKIKETALYCGNGQAPACLPEQRRFNPYMLNYSILTWSNPKIHCTDLNYMSRGRHCDDFEEKISPFTPYNFVSEISNYKLRGIICLFAAMTIVSKRSTIGFCNSGGSELNHRRCRHSVS